MRLQQAGRLDEAASLYAKVLESDPDHPEANHYLGLLLHAQGRAEDGWHLLVRSLGADPANADFRNNIGTVLKEAGRLQESREVLREAVALRPDFALAWNNLGVTERQLGELDAAIGSYRKALSFNPSYVAARVNLANAEREAGHHAEAIADYRAALQLRPNDPETHYQLGSSLMEHGEIERAQESFRKTIMLRPRHAEAHLMLASLRRPAGEDAEMSAMKALFGRPDATEEEKMLLAFALAKSLEDIGRHDEAFEYLLAGNALRRQTFDYSHEATKGHFEEIRSVFTPSLFEKFGEVGSMDETPVFIVGMPRSGTTLVEQILASHPDVFAPGELSILQSVAARTFSIPGKSAFPANMEQIAPAVFERAGADYVQALRGHSADARRITDKMPGNFMLIGLIRLILPRATVIHCVRDAPATCLSIFKTFFRSKGHLYAYDLKELGDYYNLYAGLMRYWHEVLPGFVVDVRYEELVADQEPHSRALVDACGLPWDDRCLAFHEATRPVRTASAAQVRQPMYDSSLRLWRRYGEGLAPLLERLEGAPISWAGRRAPGMNRGK